MNQVTESIGNQRGMVLVISVLILSLLMTAGVGAIVSMQTDFKITGNLKNGTQAFYLAEAGIEWGKEQIKKTALNPPNPAGGTQKLSPGEFSVTFMSPKKLSLDSSSVIIRSSGSWGSSSHVIQALVTKTYLLSDGAIGLRGNGGRVSFSGDAFQVDGRDYDPVSGTLVADARPWPAISVSSETLKGQVEGALSSEQYAQLVGKGESPPSIEKSGFLPSETLTQLASALCQDPQAIVAQAPSEGTLRVAGATWGSRGSPQLRCIDGSSTEGGSLTIGGDLTGVGILVVRDAEMVIRGSFRWEGLILVSGNRVGFRTEEGAIAEIYGSVLINERGEDLLRETETLKLQGEIRLRYSSAALKNVVSLIPQAAVESVYNSLPTAITQNYWRAISP